MKLFLTRIVVITILFLALNWFLAAIILHYSDSRAWNDFNDLRSLDVLITGSSHAAFGINPIIMDSILRMKSFNLSSPAQSPKTAYYLIKNAVESYKPKIIIQELFFYTFFVEDQLLNGMPPLTRIQNTRVLADIWWNELGSTDKLISLFPLTYLKKDIKNLIDQAVLGVSRDTHSYDIFYAKGFYGFDEIVKKDELERSSLFDSSKNNFAKIEEEQLLYLAKIAKLCLDTGIKLYWITTPMPKLALKEKKAYLDFSGRLGNYADSLDQIYVDFNLIDIGLIDTLHFKDSDHLNHSGADKFSYYLGKYLKRIYKMN